MPGTLGDVLREKGKQQEQVTGDAGRILRVPCSSWSFCVTRDQGRQQPVCHDSTKEKTSCAGKQLHLDFDELLAWHDNLDRAAHPSMVRTASLVFKPTDKILVLGDTDFKFTAGILTRFEGVPLDIVATTFQSQAAAMASKGTGYGTVETAGVLGIGFSVTPTPENVEALEKKYGKFDVVIYNILASQPDFDVVPLDGRDQLALTWKRAFDQQGLEMTEEVARRKRIAITTTITVYEILRLVPPILNKHATLKIVGFDLSFRVPSYINLLNVRSDILPFDYLTFPMYYPTRAIGKNDCRMMSYHVSHLVDKPLPESVDGLPGVKMLQAKLAKALASARPGAPQPQPVPSDACFKILRTLFEATPPPTLAKATTGFRGTDMAPGADETDEQELADEIAALKQRVLAKQRKAAEEAAATATAAGNARPSKRRKLA